MVTVTFIKIGTVRMSSEKEVSHGTFAAPGITVEKFYLPEAKKKKTRVNISHELLIRFVSDVN